MSIFVFKWAITWDFGTYRISELWYLNWACAVLPDAQSRDLDEDSDQELHLYLR